MRTARAALIAFSVLLLVPVGTQNAFAFTCFTLGSGTWNDPNTWQNCGGGVPDDTGDTATIGGTTLGDVVQLNNNFVVGTVTVAEGGTLSINAKLTSQPLFVREQISSLFINCNGELVLTEGGSNEGLITNHGILQTVTGATFTNTGTYQSSGTDIFVGPFTGNPIVPIASICLIGGTLVPIDTTSLLLVGAQSTAAWMIPVIIAGIGIAIVITRKF